MRLYLHIRNVVISVRLQRGDMKCEMDAKGTGLFRKVCVGWNCLGHSVQVFDWKTGGFHRSLSQECEMIVKSSKEAV